jgi:outer membrane murein-binding lipoprotein Lpp
MKKIFIILWLGCLLLSGCTDQNTTNKIEQLNSKVKALEEKLAIQERTIKCLSSPVLSGTYYATTSASWTIYSIEFLTCSLIKMIAYDDYGDLDAVRYYFITETDDMKFKITGELVQNDSTGTLSFSSLEAIWEGKDDFLRYLTVSSDYQTLDFGSVNDVNQSRRYAVLNNPDENFWLTRKKY